ncbi:hypothetical protein [Solidesulfovibrio carbinolicus]|uniref:Phage tail protein n=1 Tax=Solidesulfovibrio carbinolicus TaxID=296842 RepID=A0A4P6HP90_9BACT|nr:hypothetical protein [Solidesulfovibrio carbinolicus]QAZ69091.1 hypothetical protein C3Y92_18345 [Solidesulfovibrio carbinolicus]
MADLIYASFKEGLGKGHFDLAADTVRCALLTSAYVPSAGHAALADVAASEASGAGYTAGGQTLSGVAWTLAGTSAALAAADPSWSQASITARYALIYVAKTVAGRTNPLVCLLDFGTDRGVTGGTFSVRFDASGVLALE